MSLPPPSDIYERQININRGSDWDKVVPLKKADGEPFDLLNWEIDIYDHSPQLADLVSVEVLDEESGLIRLRIDWSEILEVGKVYQFRIRLASESDDATTKAIGVCYQ